MRGVLSDFSNDGDTILDRIDYPLFRAMSAGVKELEVTPEEFVLCMRYAVMNDVYYQSEFPGAEPYILSMKILIV